MSNNERWQRGLLQAVLQVSLVLLLVLGGIMGVAAIAQRVGHGAIESQQRRASSSAHFWRVIAGETTSSQPTVDNKLAEDIKSLLGPRDVTARRLPEKILDFRGDPNSYGGITDAIGRDPFDESGQGGCQECGPLDDYTRTQLLRIKQGRLSQVLLSERVAGPGSYVLTPWGWSGSTTVLVLWALGGPLVLGIAWRAIRPGYKWDNLAEAPRHFSDLSWKLGDGEADGVKLGTVLSAPTFFVPYFAWRGVNRHRFERRVLDKFPEHLQLVDETDLLVNRLALKRGDDPEIAKLIAMRDDVLAEVKSQTRVGEVNRSDDQQLEEMRERLSRSYENLTLRKDTLDEMNVPKGGKSGDS